MHWMAVMKRAHDEGEVTFGEAKERAYALLTIETVELTERIQAFQASCLTARRLVLRCKA